MSKPLSLRQVFLVTLMLLLTACGYHLRGSYALPERLKQMYLQGESLALREQFRLALRTASGQLLSAPNNAGVIVHIINEENSQQVLSLNARGRSNELELYYRLNYEILDAGQNVLAPAQTVEIKREYFNNQDDIVAKANEESVIRTEMRNQAVRSILDRARVVLAATTHVD